MRSGKTARWLGLAIVLAVAAISPVRAASDMNGHDSGGMGGADSSAHDGGDTKANDTTRQH